MIQKFILFKIYVKKLSISCSIAFINSFFDAQFNNWPLICILHRCQWTRKLSIYMKEFCGLFKKTNCHLMNNSQKKMCQFLLIIETSCYRHASDKTLLVLKNCNWYFYTEHRSRISERSEDLGYLLWIQSVIVLDAPPLKAPKIRKSFW